MAFQSITPSGRAGRPTGSGHPAALTIVGKHGSKSPTGTVYYLDRLRFRIANSLWKQAELEPGNKVEVLFDKDRGMAIIAPSDTGYTLTCTNVGRGNFDLIFGIPHIESTGFPFYNRQTGMEDIEVKDGCIYFRVVFPGDPAFSTLGQAHQGNGEHQQSIKGKKLTK